MERIRRDLQKDNMLQTMTAYEFQQLVVSAEREKPHQGGREKREEEALEPGVL